MRQAHGGCSPSSPGRRHCTAGLPPARGERSRRGGPPFERRVQDRRCSGLRRRRSIETPGRPTRVEPVICGFPQAVTASGIARRPSARWLRRFRKSPGLHFGSEGLAVFHRSRPNDLLSVDEYHAAFLPALGHVEKNDEEIVLPVQEIGQAPGISNVDFACDHGPIAKADGDRSGVHLPHIRTFRCAWSKAFCRSPGEAISSAGLPCFSPAASPCKADSTYFILNTNSCFVTIFLSPIIAIFGAVSWDGTVGAAAGYVLRPPSTMNRMTREGGKPLSPLTFCVESCED